MADSHPGSLQAHISIQEQPVKKGGNIIKRREHHIGTEKGRNLGFSNVTPIFAQILENLKSRLTILMNTYVIY